jgi:NMD protein affecting ribosome stability and mRNA decay
LLDLPEIWRWLNAHVEYILSLNGEQKVERHGVPYIFNKQLCPRCSRFSGDYFESIIQMIY